MALRKSKQAEPSVAVAVFAPHDYVPKPLPVNAEDTDCHHCGEGPDEPIHGKDKGQRLHRETQVKGGLQAGASFEGKLDVQHSSGSRSV